MTSGKFSLQWVNHADFNRPMGSVRFNLRDALSPTGESGLTCSRLHLDQVHIHFRPNTELANQTLMPRDSVDMEWVNETLQLYARITPGARYVLYTDGAQSTTVDPHTVPHPQRSLVYSAALSPAHATSGDGDDTFCKTYRPIRDLPVLEHVANLTELQVDLLWPLLQGDSKAVWWSVPDYRILRVICEFSYTQ